MLPELEYYLNDTAKDYSKEEIAKLSEMVSDDDKKRIMEYVCGFVETYHIIPVEKMYSIITEEYGESWTEEQFWAGCCLISTDKEVKRTALFGSEYAAYGGEKQGRSKKALLIHASLVQVDIEFFEQMITAQSDKPYKVLPKEHITAMYHYGCDYSSSNILNEENRKLYDFLIQSGFDRGNVVDAVDDAYIVMRNCNEDIIECMRDTVNHLYLADPDDAFLCGLYREIADMRNCASQPFNRGYSPAETEKMKNESGRDWESGYAEALTPAQIIESYNIMKSKGEMLRDAFAFDALFSLEMLSGFLQ